MEYIPIRAMTQNPDPTPRTSITCVGICHLNLHNHLLKILISQFRNPHFLNRPFPKTREIIDFVSRFHEYHRYRWDRIRTDILETTVIHISEIVPRKSKCTMSPITLYHHHHHTARTAPNTVMSRNVFASHNSIPTLSQSTSSPTARAKSSIRQIVKQRLPARGSEHDRRQPPLSPRNGWHEMYQPAATAVFRARRAAVVRGLRGRY